MPDEIMQRRAVVTAGTINETARSVDVILATEDPVMAYDWTREEYVDEILLIDGIERAEQVPFLSDHEIYDIDDALGSLRNMRAEDGKLIATAYFADDGGRASRAWNMVQGGHLTDVSIGARTLARTYINKGETVAINGKSYTATDRTLRVVTQSKLIEGSLVTVGADAAAKILRSEQFNLNRAASAHGEKGMPDATPPAAPAAEPITRSAPQHPAPDLSAIRQQAAAEERSRVAEITRSAEGLRPSFAADLIDRGVSLADARDRISAEKHRIDAIKRAASDDQDLSQTVTRAIDEGWTEAQFNAEALRIVRSRLANPPAHIDTSRMNDNMVAFRSAVSDAMVLRAGFGIKGDDAAKRSREAEAVKVWGLQELARNVLNIQGKTAPNGTEDLFRAAISTVDFAETLSDSAAKMLVAAYQEHLGTWAEWCSTEDLPDFKSHKGIRVSGFSRMSKIGPGGDLEHGAMGEAYESIQADTYGKMFTVDRQKFINDSLSAFSRIPVLMGRAAAANIDDLVYGTDMLGAASGVGPTMNEDSTALFSASHSVSSPDKKKTGTNVNYITGSTTTLSFSSLSTLKTNMRKIIGQAGEKLNLLPVVLLVPPELEETARQLVASEMVYGVQGTGGTAQTNLPAANTFRGTMRVVVEPRLSDISTTGWYLVASPLQAQSVTVGFLRGQRAPTVENVDLSNTATLGLGWRVYHDVGVAAMDYRGIARSKGAA